MTLAARIRRLSVAFHERTILHDITLDIPVSYTHLTLPTN